MSKRVLLAVLAALMTLAMVAGPAMAAPSPPEIVTVLCSRLVGS